MKARFGFVSNSSTSSFVVWGCKFDLKKIEKRINREDFSIYEYFAPKCDNSSLDWHSSQWDECVIVGLSPNLMEEDETLKEFKQRIIDTLKKSFPEVEVDGEVIYVEIAEAEY